MPTTGWFDDGTLMVKALDALEAIVREGRADIARAGEGHCAGMTFAVAQAERVLAQAGITTEAAR